MSKCFASSHSGTQQLQPHLATLEDYSVSGLLQKKKNKNTKLRNLFWRGLLYKEEHFKIVGFFFKL